MTTTPFHLLRRTARSQLGLFLVEQAESTGLTREALRTLRRRGQVIRLSEHVYEVAGTPDSRRKRMLAALLAAGPSAVLSHSSAGWLHRMFDVEPRGIEILYPRGCARRDVPGARVRTSRTLCLARDVTRLGVVRLTDIERTICDLAGHSAERALRLIVLDAVRRTRTTPRAISARLQTLGRAPGGPMLRSILRDCDPNVGRARSTWEAEALALVRRADVPQPVVNLVLEHPDGSPRYELDLAWPHLRFAYELQSRTFHTIRPDALKDERKRGELEAEGWAIRSLPLDLIRQDPNRFVRQVRRDLRTAARRSGADPVRGV